MQIYIKLPVIFMTNINQNNDFTQKNGYRAYKICMGAWAKLQKFSLKTFFCYLEAVPKILFYLTVTFLSFKAPYFFCHCQNFQSIFVIGKIIFTLQNKM